MFLNPGQARLLFEDAAVNGYAVLAVNADSPAAVADCLLAARSCDAPIVIEASLWQLTGHSFGVGDPFAGVQRYVECVRGMATSKAFADVPVGFHTDHIKGPETGAILRHAMRTGASSLSLDSSELSAGENIRVMTELCAFAEDGGFEAALEMEAGVDDGVTDTDEARDLFGAVEKVHPGFLVLWAPGVGTRHGLARAGGGFSAEAVARHREAVSGIAGRPVGIALHGSSGLGDEELRGAVSAGVTKVNWSSESLLLRSRAMSDYYSGAVERLVPGHRRFKETAMDTAAQRFVSERYVPAVADRIRTLGGGGRAPVLLELFHS